MGLLEFFAGGGFAVPAAALQDRRAPALDSLVHHCHGFFIAGGGVGDELVECSADRRGIVAVDLDHGVADRLEFGRRGVGRLLLGHPIRLAVAVAVENRQDVGEFVVGDEVDRLPDLSFARFAIANEAIDAFVVIVVACGDSQPGCHRQTLAERSGGGIEKWEAFDRIGMAIDRRIVGPQRAQVVLVHRPPLAIDDDGPAQVGIGRVDDRHRVAFGQHQAI